MYGNGHVYVYWRVASCFSINIRDVECKKPGVATFSMSTIDVSNHAVRVVGRHALTIRPMSWLMGQPSSALGTGVRGRG